MGIFDFFRPQTIIESDDETGDEAHKRYRDSGSKTGYNSKEDNHYYPSDEELDAEEDEPEEEVKEKQRTILFDENGDPYYAD